MANYEIVLMMKKGSFHREARSAVQTTLMFLEQKRDDDIEVCRDGLLLMRRLLEKVRTDHMKQGQLAASTSK